MLNIENLEQFAKLKQTDVENAVREYYQHLFLSFLYQHPGSENLLFKGGTALRIIFQSPRFSEDLDFTGTHITIREVENLFAGSLSEIEKTGKKSQNRFKIASRIKTELRSRTEKIFTCQPCNADEKFQENIGAENIKLFGATLIRKLFFCLN